MHRTLSPQERQASVKRILENKHLATCTAAFKLQRSQELFRLRERRLSEARLNRSFKLQAERDQRIQKLVQKKKGFEMRMRSPEIREVTQRWMVAMIAMVGVDLLWKMMQSRIVRPR